MVLTVILLVLTSLICVLLTLYMKKYSYWKNKNVTGPKPAPFVGNLGKVMLMADSMTMFSQKIYSAYPNENVVGIYQGNTPMLILRDPDLIRDVLIKDFGYFSDRGTRISNDVLSDNLFNAEVDSWRKLRHGFTPMFSSGKLKAMSPLINTCVEEFQIYVDTLVDGSVPHEVRALMAKYTLEVIGSCAFGLKLGALTQEENLFTEIGEIIFKPRLVSTFLRGVDMIVPGIVKFLNIKLADSRIVKFFQNLMKKVVNEREGKPQTRKDFMDLLIEMRDRQQMDIDSHDVDKALTLKITQNVMAAQAVVFYAAGFETSSAAMSFLLYELALNQTCQEKVYQEINKAIVKYDGVNYDAVCEMNYLEMAFDEILRKYPPGGLLIRRCVTDYTFSKGKLKINKGVKVLIPVYGLHRDPKYFENPEEFIPERFSPEKKRNIYPCTYIPFGEGPRNCIGMRFAKIESMMGLAGFLHKYKVEPSPKTKIPLEYDRSSITMKSRDGIWLNIKKR